MMTLNQRRVLVLHPSDNVAVALTPLMPGETVAVADSTMATAVQVQMSIPTGHKVALCPLPKGRTVIKYGQPVGMVTQDIATGEHVHIHNVVSARAG
jgi:altronate dehydratase